VAWRRLRISVCKRESPSIASLGLVLVSTRLARGLQRLGFIVEL
jgi:hypothetical protein